MDLKSAERAFQYAKAMKCGDLDAAKLINEVKDVFPAKRTGNKIQSNEHWIPVKM